MKAKRSARVLGSPNPINGPKGIDAEQVLAAAAKLFRERGYASTTTRELAAALGIQKASLYHYVDSKEDLLYTLSRQTLENLTSAVKASLGQSSSSEDRLRAVIRTHVTTMLADPERRGWMLIELKELSKKRRQEIINLRDSYQQLITDTIAACQKDGYIRREISARVLTLTLLNIMNWTIFWYQPGGALTPKQLAEVYCTVFILGAQSPQARKA